MITSEGYNGPKVCAAVEQLWDWVGERCGHDYVCHQGLDLNGRRYVLDVEISYNREIKEKMRTLFAGLIDFDSEE